MPENEGKIQHEEMPLIPLGHGLGHLESFLAGKFRIFGQQIGYHAVFKALDDTGNDEEQAPQANLNAHPEHNQTHMGKLLQRGEDFAEAGLQTAAHFKETKQTDRKRKHQQYLRHQIENILERGGSLHLLARLNGFVIAIHDCLHFILINRRERLQFGLVGTGNQAANRIDYPGNTTRNDTHNNESDQSLPKILFQGSFCVCF